MKICFFNFLCIIPSATTHTLSPSCLICSLLHLQPNSLYTLFNLSTPCVLRLSLPFASSTKAFFLTLTSFLLAPCAYHLTPFAIAIWLIFPLNPVFPSPSHHSCHPLISLHILISPWLFVFLRLSSHLPSRIMFHFHIMLLIFHNYDMPSFSFSEIPSK